MNQEIKVAVIGLGAMGLPIATNLARAGYPTQGWNRSESAREAASRVGISTPANLNEIDARIVFVTLPRLSSSSRLSPPSSKCYYGATKLY